MTTSIRFPMLLLSCSCRNSAYHYRQGRCKNQERSPRSLFCFSGVFRLFSLFFGTLLLEQRSKQAQHAVPDSFPNRNVFPAVLFRNFPALREQILKVLAHIRDSRNFIHPNRIFKLQIQTAVIQINRPDNCRCIIGNKNFGVTEARCIFKNPYPSPNKPGRSEERRVGKECRL